MSDYEPGSVKNRKGKHHLFNIIVRSHNLSSVDFCFSKFIDMYYAFTMLPFKYSGSVINRIFVSQESHKVGSFVLRTKPLK